MYLPFTSTLKDKKKCEEKNHYIYLAIYSCRLRAAAKEGSKRAICRLIKNTYKNMFYLRLQNKKEKNIYIYISGRATKKKLLFLRLP